MKILRIDIHHDGYLDTPLEWLYELLKLDPKEFHLSFVPGCSDSEVQHVSLQRVRGCAK